MANLFPTLKPNISNKLWFSMDNNTIIESDAELTKKENEYSQKIKDEINQGQNILPIGKIEEKNEEPVEEEEEAEEDEESNEELDDDTDEFDTPSNEIESIEEDQMT